MDLRFVLKSKINPADIKYNLIIEEWTENDFIVNDIDQLSYELNINKI